MAKPKFDMWRPTTTIPLGAAPATHLEDPKWYDKLSKRPMLKPELALGAESVGAEL